MMRARCAHVGLSDQRERTKWTRAPYLVGGPAALGHVQYVTGRVWSSTSNGATESPRGVRCQRGRAQEGAAGARNSKHQMTNPQQIPMTKTARDKKCSRAPKASRPGPARLKFRSFEFSACLGFRVCYLVKLKPCGLGQRFHSLRPPHPSPLSHEARGRGGKNCK
jgi:hypothetical protein